MIIRFQVYSYSQKLAFKLIAVVAIGLFIALIQMLGSHLGRAWADELPHLQPHSVPKTDSIERKSELNSQFEKALDDVNKSLPSRITSELEFNVAGIVKPFIPEIKTAGEAIEFLEIIGLKPRQDKWDSGIVFTLAYVDYERLKSNHRGNFRRGDRLVLSFTSRSDDPNEVISDFISSVLNDRLF